MTSPNIEISDVRFTVVGSTATQLRDQLDAQVKEVQEAFWPDSEVTCRINVYTNHKDGALSADCWMFDRIRESPNYPTVPGEDGPVVVPPAPGRSSRLFKRSTT